MPRDFMKKSVIIDIIQEYKRKNTQKEKYV